MKCIILKIAGFFTLLVLLNFNSYAQIPTNYYSTTSGKTGNTLRAALRDITKTGHVKLPYTSTSFDVWDAYSYTDVRPAPQNTIVWDMYSDIPGGTPAYTFTIYTNQCGNASVEGDCYSREHSMPNSWWGGFDNSTNPQYSDLHHLFPADQYVNLKKSNNPLGQTTTPTWTSTNGSKVGPCTVSGYTGTIFEPINEYKGDFARAQLYLVTRYMNEIGTWVKNYPSTEAKYVIDTISYDFKSWYLNMLIQWHNIDPVSQKEINRNNAIYYNTPQNNRNPFIDHPEYVCLIWGGAQCGTPPVISSIALSKSNPNQFDNINVLASVTDDGSVSSVQLKWGTDSINLNNIITMNLSSSLYQTSSPIPAQSSAKVYFKIIATDNYANTTTSTLNSYSISNVKPEPTYFPFYFTVNPLKGRNFVVEWTDPTAGVIPDGYLLKMSKYYGPIYTPVDGIPESNDTNAFVINPGFQAKVIYNITVNHHEFKIFPFTNSGSLINYKTNGLSNRTGFNNDCNCGQYKTAFAETVGRTTSSSISSHKFNNSSLSFSGTADISNTNQSTGYQFSSGNSNVVISNTPGNYFEISGINTTSLVSPLLEFGVYKSTTNSNGSDLVIEVSCNGVNYTPVQYTTLPTGTGSDKWYFVKTTGNLSNCSNLRIRFKQNGSSTTFKLDDIYVNEPGY